MKGITEFALNNTRLVVVTMLGILFGGILIFQDLPKLEDPSITIREAVIVAKNPGMPVEQVERLITRPIEEQLRSMGEVDDISDSTSKVGESIIHAEIKDEVPSEQLEMVWKILRNKMSDLEPDLPKGTIGPLVNDTFGDTSVATIALWSDGFEMSDMYEVARKARERLNLLYGIKKIELTGVQEERIYIDIANAKLAELGVSPDAVARTLKQQNILSPGGNMNINGVELVIRPLGHFSSIEEIGDVLIPIAEGKASIPLRDIATIRKGYVEPPKDPAYFNGHPAIVLSVFLRKGIDAVAFGERLKAEVEGIERSLPWGFKLDFATFQPNLITKSVDGMVSNVIQSVLIVLVVVMLLLGFRTGLIVGSFIPLVMLFGVVMMKVMGIELQRMSLATMIIALGMFVDNAIVVADDIKVNLQKGMERKDAVIRTGRSLAVPLLTSTLTTIFAFGPIVLQIGSAGDYTSSVGSVMIVLLMASWFFSMYSSPYMCFVFMKTDSSKDDDKEEDPYEGKFYDWYRGFLHYGLRNRVLVIGLVSLAFFLSVLGLRMIPQSFFPQGDRNQFLVYLDLPAGTHIEETDRIVRKFTGWLQDKERNPEITSTIAYVGNGGPRFFLSLAPVDPDPINAFVIVNLKSNKQVPELVERTHKHLLDEYPNVLGRVKAMWLGPTETGLLEVRLSGPNTDVLSEQAEELMAGLRAIPGTVDVKHDWLNRVFVGMVEVDQKRARRAGITSQDVARSLQFFIDGSIITNFYPGNVEIPIIGRGFKTEREMLSHLYTFSIYSQRSKQSVPLSQIADIYAKGEFNRIVRYNQERTITVSAKNKRLKASELLEAITPTIEKIEFPKYHYWEIGGELENSSIARHNLSKWVPLCLGAIVILLILQFNSFRRAAIIMLTMPLVLVGAVIGLLVMNADFGFMVILGLLALAGSIVNNGIVMIDKIEENRREGQDPYDAVVGSAVSRFRPILLSVSTTMLGFLPLILSRDPLFYGMACVMFFGLGIGSIFTLNFVPALYTLFFGITAQETKNSVT